MEYFIMVPPECVQTCHAGRRQGKSWNFPPDSLFPHQPLQDAPMKMLAASITALMLLAPVGAYAVGANIEVLGVGVGAHVGGNGVGAGAHVGGVGAGAGVDKHGVAAGGHAGSVVGTGASVGDRGVHTGAHVGSVGAGGGLDRRGVGVGGHVASSHVGVGVGGRHCYYRHHRRYC
jgi:hypothetical protein